jgi:four helix bundle protein
LSSHLSKAAALVALPSLRLAYRPEARALFDQLRRAAVSVEANIVEGYGLGSWRQFARHLRIAMGSAAEAECLTRLAEELGYLPIDSSTSMKADLERCMAAMTGLLRRLPATKSLTHR